MVPIGRGRGGHTQTTQEEWIAVTQVPAIVTQEQFDLVQAKLSHNQQFAKRNNTAYPYLLRALVSCGTCRLGCVGRSSRGGYAYYVCHGKSHGIISRRDEKCSARSVPVEQLDELVWQDVCEVLTHPDMIATALYRAQGGQWLPQELQARRENLRKARVSLEQQAERLTDAYLANVLQLEEYKRRRLELEQRLSVIAEQKRQLEANVGHHDQLAGMVQSIEAFCQRVQQGLSEATFEQKRQLIELLIDRVVVTGEEVEIRYVIPTSSKGEYIRFCHLRLDYFDTPMATHQIEEASRTGLDRSEVGDEVNHLLGGLAGLAHGDRPCQASDLTHQWPSGSQIVVHATTDLKRAGLGAPPMPIDGAVLLIGRNERVGITEIGGQICIEGGLVAFDGQHTGPGAHMNDLHEVGVGMQGVSRVDARMQRQAGQERLGNGDFVGFLADTHLQQRFLTVMGTERQQMGTFVLGGGSSTHRLAVQGDGFLIAVGATGIDPGSQHQLDVTHTQARQQATIEGASGCVKVAWPKEATQQQGLVATPLPHRFQRVAVAEQGGHQARQQVGQIVALSMLGAWIRHGGKRFIQAEQGRIRQQGGGLLIGQIRECESKCGRIHRQRLLFLLRSNWEVLS